MRLAQFACSLCGSRHWPDPDSECQLCQPSNYDPEDRWKYEPDPDHERDDYEAQAMIDEP